MLHSQNLCSCGAACFMAVSKSITPFNAVRLLRPELHQSGPPSPVSQHRGRWEEWDGEGGIGWEPGRADQG